MLDWFRCHLGYCLSCEMGSLGKEGTYRGDLVLPPAQNFLCSSFTFRHFDSISLAHSHNTSSQTIPAISGLIQVSEAGMNLPKNLASSLFHEAQILWRQNPCQFVRPLPHVPQHQTSEAWLGCASSHLGHFGSIAGPGTSPGLEG